VEAAVPESKIRKKKAYTPQAVAQDVVRPTSPNWWAPVMVALFLIGLLWIVVYYIAGADLPIMKNLGWWNVIVGFAFIAGGFGMSTRWR
jgi:NAD/NADP transhydrogenase beta subunit